MNEHPLFQKYSDELEEDVIINRVNMEEKQFLIPKIKHKWLHRLYTHRYEMIKLNDKRDDLANSFADEKDLGLPKFKINKMVQSSKEYKEITNKILQLQELIGFLEETLKILNSMSYELKTIADILKLEQM